MRWYARVMMAAAGLCLAAAFFFPLWWISLRAPQYPEGLGMVIWTSGMKGIKPHDIESINNLNHYIGMKKIHPDEILELKTVPWALGILALWALAAGLSGRRRLAGIWVLALMAYSVFILVRFWAWEYDYGHNLDMENAIMKIPGMTYQPPLIGYKKLLNFEVWSYAGAGGWLCATAMGLGALAFLLPARSSKRTES
jgi:copper chaperone NosL